MHQQSVFIPHPTSVPLTHLHNDQDVCRSFLNISSTLSSLIVSTLLQNPAVHAADLAASFCSPTIIPPTSNIQQVHNTRTNSTPSLEAIVATAAAWWATHGLLPCFPPLARFTFVPPNRNVPSAGILQIPVLVTSYENFPKEKQQIGDLNKSEVIKPKHDSSKLLSSASASDDCDGRDEN